MDAVTVYGMKASGNCFKVQLLLEHLSRPYRWVEIDRSSYLSSDPWQRAQVEAQPGFVPHRY